ncbi:unnamed protein product, partial [Iphiclides podalirius]
MKKIWPLTETKAWDRLYNHPTKRESAASETTTTTLLVPRTSLAPHHDGRHLHAEYITSGSASGDQSPV